MSYNKARAEKEWLKWKNEEESKLRELGVSEDIIQRLHIYDWQTFNSDRRFYRRLSDYSLEEIAEEQTDSDNVKTIDDILDEIENEKMLFTLKQADKVTLQALLMRIQGFSMMEIGKHLGLSTKAVYKRIERLAKKIKK